MKRKQSFSLFLLAICFSASLFSDAKAIGPAPDPADAKAVITDYINAVGGMDAIKKINSRKDSGTFSVQGMSLPMTQKYMAPNKFLQSVTMNGTTVAKTVFDGEKGYQEQMGNHVDIGSNEMTDMKMRAFAILQATYLTNDAYKLSLLGTEKVDDKDTYKILVTMPSGDADTEYYDKATKFLVKQVLTKTVSGQTVLLTYNYSDYRKAGSITTSFKQSLSISSGALNQSIDINLSDVKVNEDVAATDFM